MERVLVTRPQPSATRTAENLKALGHRPFVLPLTRTEARPIQEIPDPSVYQAIVITSANAVRHAPTVLVERFARIPGYAVGQKTAEAAHAAGLTVAGVGSGDAEGLVRRIVGLLAPGSRILVMCGRVRRDALEQGLKDAGLYPQLLETYDTIGLSPSDSEIIRTVEDEPVDAILLYSGSAAEAYLGLIARPQIARLFANARLIAISGRVAQRLPRSASVHVAAEPTEESMFSLLAKTK